MCPRGTLGSVVVFPTSKFRLLCQLAVGTAAGTTAREKQINSTKGKHNMSTPKQVIETAKKAGAKMVDIKFVDTFGTWQHFSLPISQLTEEVFEEGLGFDGSSIR